MSKTKKFYEASDKNIYLDSHLITNSAFETVDTDTIYVLHLKRLGMISIDQLFSHAFHALDDQSNPEIVTEQYLPSHALLWLPKLLNKYTENLSHLENTAIALQSYSVVKVKSLYTVYHFKDDTNQQHQQFSVVYYLYASQENLVEPPYLPLNPQTFYIVESSASLEYIVMDVAKLALDTSEPSQDVLKLLKQFLKKSTRPDAEKKMEKIVNKLLEMFEDIKSESQSDPRKIHFDSLKNKEEEEESLPFSFPSSMQDIQVEYIAPIKKHTATGTIKIRTSATTTTESVDDINERPKRRQKTKHSNVPQLVVNEVDHYVNEVGRWGEEFVYRLLKEKYPNYEIEWYNATLESGKPADFEVRENGQVLYYIEAKATNKQSVNSNFFVSQAEWEFAQKERNRFQIYRVFGYQADKQFVRVLTDPFGMFLEGHLNLKSTEKYHVTEIID